MSKKLMLAALIVIGTLIAPAAQASHPQVQGQDYICHLLGEWIGDISATFGCERSDRTATANANDTDPVCLGCPGLPTAPRDGGDVDPRESEVETVGGNDSHPYCLACGGHPTPPPGDRDKNPS